MRLNASHPQLALLVCVIVAAAAAAPQSLPGCNDTCGGVSIPYPFGTGISSITGKNCSLNKSFKLTCNDSKLITGKNIQVLNISIQGQLEMSFFVSRSCYNKSGGVLYKYPYINTPLIYTINSTENKFITVGCNSYGYLNNYRNGLLYSTGCLTKCLNRTEYENNLFWDRVLPGGHSSWNEGNQYSSIWLW